MADPTLRTPHDLRIRARLDTYPNTETEREALAAVDDAAFSATRALEHQMAARGDALRDSVRDQLVQTATLSQDMTDLRLALEDATTVTPELAEQYERVRATAEGMVGTLERAHGDLDFHARRLEDPYATYLDMIRKWPSLWKSRP